MPLTSDAHRQAPMETSLYQEVLCAGGQGDRPDLCNLSLSASSSSSNGTTSKSKVPTSHKIPTSHEVLEEK